MHTAALPDDPQALKALIGELVGQLEAREQTLSALQAQIDRLQLQIAVLRRARFGRRSEQLDAQLAQLELVLEELRTARAEALADEPPKPESAQQPSRRPLPAHLPRETHMHAPEETACPACGGALKSLGEDVTELLEYVPASFKVIRQVRPKLACSCCDAIVQAPAPSRPIARGLAGPGLLAHVLVGKYTDHLPLYRQSAIYAREGVELPRSTLAEWVGGAHHLLRPLVAALRAYVLDTAKLHGDDTPIPVLAPGNGKTATGRLWTYVRDDRPAAGDAAPAVWFAYSPNRRGEHPQQHLQSYQGILQADAYAGFGALFDSGRVQWAACWAHARRKFYEIAEAHDSPLAHEALKRIAKLYEIEGQIRGRPPEQRRAERQARAGPVLEDLHAWLKETVRGLSQKSGLGGAIHYALKLWPALTRYVDDGRIEIDNNAAERALRAVALGRKNYLFAGSDAGGERAASIYSLIGSAKLNGIDPEAYLREVFTRIADHPVNRVDELLPWNLKIPSVTDQAAA
jgi:transposase